MPTLYEIAADLAALDALLADVGGDVTEEAAEAAVDAWLAETGAALREKLDGYAALIREREASAKARDEEAARLAALARADANTAKRLKDRLAWFLNERGEKKPIETPRFRISLCANGGPLPVSLLVPPADLPADLREERVSHHALTDLIRQQLATGEPVLDANGAPLAVLGQRGYHVRIK